MILSLVIPAVYFFFFFVNMFIPRIDISLPISLVISLFLIQCR